jgi:hypothetical protein
MNNKFKIAGAAFASALFAGSALAEITLTPNLSVDGYAAGSAQYIREKTDVGGATSDDSTLDLDAVRLNANFKYDKVSAKISLYSGEAAFGTDNIVIPEAYVSYDFGNGIVGTAGRFLTWAGYEAFDIPATSAITYGDEYAIIPSHHNGVKVTYSFDNFTVGAAVLDSVWGSYKGDGDINHGSLGTELYFAYDDQTFSAAATIGYQHDYAPGGSSDIYFANVWGQYYIDSSKTTLGAEFTYAKWEYATSDDTYMTVLVSAKQAINEKWAITGRLSGGLNDESGVSDNSKFIKASVVPSLTLSENLEVRAEVSYTTFDKDWDNRDSKIFVGVQAVFKF